MFQFYSFSQFALLGLSLLPLAATAQNVDSLLVVHATDAGHKVSRATVFKNGGLLLGGTFDGNYNSSAIPAEGSGTRLMWYPARAAFRAGYVSGTQWDDANIGNYSTAMGQSVRALGDYSTAIGKDNTAANFGTVALGEFCTAVGVNSVALGYHANTRTGAGGPRQGSFVFADRSVLDNNVINDYADEFYCETNHSASWRVTGGFRVVTAGTTNSIVGYIPSRGVSILPGTTNGLTTDWGQSTALIATSSGAYLSDGGTWTNSSDRRKKHLLETVSGEDLLAKLRLVPITRWSYKADPATVRHLGPMAQDFRRAFGLGQDSISIATVDADGVALAAAQALDTRTQQQQARLAALEAENRALRAEVATLAPRLQALEQRNGSSTASASLPWVGLLALLGVGAALRRR